VWRPAPRLFATRQPGKHNRVRHGRVPDTIIVGHASALPPKADVVERDRDVRFVPKADIEFARINSETSAEIRFPPHAKSWCRIAAKVIVHAAAEQWAMVRLMWKELRRARDVSRRDYSVLSTLCGSSQVE